jgi:large subunit ribosomal protein L22
MADLRYSVAIKNNMAKASGRFLNISIKKSVEVCDSLRGKSLEFGLKLLDDVIQEKAPIQYKKHNRGGTGHKPGIGPGRYPIKTCVEIRKILKSAEANAEQKGLDSKSLFIAHICAQKAPISWHYGRMRRRKMKRAHLEVVLEESIEKREPRTKKK